MALPTSQTWSIPAGEEVRDPAVGALPLPQIHPGEGGEPMFEAFNAEMEALRRQLTYILHELGAIEPSPEDTEVTPPEVDPPITVPPVDPLIQNGVLVSWTTDNRPTSIPHILGYVPTAYLKARASDAVHVFDGDVAEWSSTHINLQADKRNVQVLLWVF